MSDKREEITPHIDGEKHTSFSPPFDCSTSTDSENLGCCSDQPQRRRKAPKNIDALLCASDTEIDLVTTTSSKENDKHNKDLNVTSDDKNTATTNNNESHFSTPKDADRTTTLMTSDEKDTYSKDKISATDAELGLSLNEYMMKLKEESDNVESTEYTDTIDDSDSESSSYNDDKDRWTRSRAICAGLLIMGLVACVYKIVEPTAHGITIHHPYIPPPPHIIPTDEETFEGTTGDFLHNDTSSQAPSEATFEMPSKDYSSTTAPPSSSSVLSISTPTTTTPIMSSSPASSPSTTKSSTSSSPTYLSSLVSSSSLLESNTTKSSSMEQSPSTFSPTPAPSFIIIPHRGRIQGKAHAIMLEQDDIKHLLTLDRNDTLDDTSSDLTVDEKINQRFTILSLWLSLSRMQDLDSNHTHTDECEWNEVTCDDNGVVTELHMARQDSWNGYISSIIGQLTHLRYVDIAENRLMGPIPKSLYELKELERVYLHDNELTGTISESIGNLEKLQYLYLSNNKLSGTLPMAIKSKPQLHYLLLGNNRLSGPLPSQLNSKRLQFLDLSVNQFSGTIPNDMFYGCHRLKFLYLDRNKLVGTVPDELVTAGSRIQGLYLAYNQLTGTFPVVYELLQNPSLSAIELQHNTLTERLDDDICEMSVFEYGDLIQLSADCGLCSCENICDQCG